MSDLAERRIAWFTPLSPVASGIALYNEELLDVLGQVWPIDVFVDGYTPTVLAPTSRLRIFPARQFGRLDRRQRYASVVYQFGNSPAHAYMYDVALRRPGVVVLHDTVVHHLRLSMVSRRGGAARYLAEMTAEYGERGAEVATHVLHGRLPHALFEFPLSEALIRSAERVVVHSQFASDQVQRWVPSVRVSVVPMGVKLPPLIDRDEARSLMDLPRDVFVLSSITAVNPYKRIDVVLRAVSRLRKRMPVLMLLAGNVSSHVPLDRWINVYGLDGAVERFGFVDDRTARLLAAASDALVNLRYPTAGETSASLLRLMAARRPVLVSDAGTFKEIPDDAVAKVPVDALEEETVEAMLEAFATRPQFAYQVGSNARRFVEDHHSIHHMVAAYHRVLQPIVENLAEPPHSDTNESIGLTAVESKRRHDVLTDQVALAMVELGLASHAKLSKSVARSMVELGLGPDKM